MTDESPNGKGWKLTPKLTGMVTFFDPETLKETGAKAGFTIGGGTIHGSKEYLKEAIARATQEFRTILDDGWESLAIREAEKQLMFMRRPGGMMDPKKEGRPSDEEVASWKAVVTEVKFNY